MKSALLCLFLTILCGLRAIQLFLASTSELRATNDHSWFPSSKKVLKQPADNNRLKNDTFVLDNNPNNIFYFVQVKKKKKKKVFVYSFSLNFKFAFFPLDNRSSFISIST
jgi:hypothetical protein